MELDVVELEEDGNAEDDLFKLTLFVDILHSSWSAKCDDELSLITILLFLLFLAAKLSISSWFVFIILP